MRARATGRNIWPKAWAHASLPIPGRALPRRKTSSREAKYDWILSLDADEELNADVQAAIREWKTTAPAASGYRFARRARYLGRWILHSGWYPDYKLRLFHRGAGRWVGDYVHESVVVSGGVETLPGEILHYTCDSLDEHRQRIEFYTDLAAREMLDRGESPGFLRRFLAPVRRKYSKWVRLRNAEKAGRETESGRGQAASGTR